ncbi:MAG: hypothetical protein ABWY08_02210 [Comamonas sp.]
MNQRTRIHAAAIAALVHIGVSVLIGGIVAAVVFGLWFPYPYRDLAGGLQLFWILIVVDVICGPLLTALVFNPQKSWRELATDLSLISFLQVAALTYGLYSISLARPVALVFETDRMVAVTAANIFSDKKQDLSWTGPILLGTREPRNGQETLKSVSLSLQGIEPSARPDWWQDYALSVSEVQKKMKPLQNFRAGLSSDHKLIVDCAVQKTNISIEQLHFLPLVAGKNLDGWIALLDGSARIVGFAPLSGFN